MEFMDCFIHSYMYAWKIITNIFLNNIEKRMRAYDLHLNENICHKYSL